MAERTGWTRDQQLVALRLYARTPFGRLHGRNPEIRELAPRIGRTADALAMKACNFASLDPAFRRTDRAGLSGASTADRALWAEFAADAEAIAAEAEAAYARLAEAAPPPPPGTPPAAEAELEVPAGPWEREQLVRVRRVQGFFRAAVLTSYEHRCALTGLDLPELLTASHITPWSESIPRRADPTNGICLNALLDRAFDRGLFTFDDGLRVVVSQRWRGIEPGVAARLDLADLHGRPLSAPSRFEPDPEAVRFHRENVFQP